MVSPLSITVEELVAMHDAALARFGGLAGVRQADCLQQVIGNAMLAEQYSGNENGTLGLCFIGSLMYYLIKNQCFMDCNKRTGLAATLKLLADLGLTLDVSQEDMKLYCEEVAIKPSISSSDVVIWLSGRIIQFE